MIELTEHADLTTCADALAGDLAAALTAAIAARGRATLALSGGRTPEAVYPRLAAADLAWRRVMFTLTDERWVDAADPQSNEGLVRRHLPIGDAGAGWIGLKTAAATPDGGLAACERELAALAWPLDAVFLGMGEDGHVASLFPDDPTWPAAAGRVIAVAATGARQPRISLTPSALLDSRRIYLVATGMAKRRVLTRALRGGAGHLPLARVIGQTRVPVRIHLAP